MLCLHEGAVALVVGLIGITTVPCAVLVSCLNEQVAHYLFFLFFMGYYYSNQVHASVEERERDMCEYVLFHMVCMVHVCVCVCVCVCVPRAQTVMTMVTGEDSGPWPMRCDACCANVTSTRTMFLVDVNCMMSVECGLPKSEVGLASFFCSMVLSTKQSLPKFKAGLMFFSTQ